MSIAGGDCKQNNTVPPGAECAARDEESAPQERYPGRVIQGDGGGSPHCGKEGEDRQRRKVKGTSGGEGVGRTEGRKSKLARCWLIELRE